MTDKLNMHNDPSGLLASVKAATDGRPYLGELTVVQGLLHQFAAEVLERYDEVGHAVLTPNDAAQADRDGCEKLSAIFLGRSDAYAPVRSWTGAPLAAHLRDRMRRDVVDSEDDLSVVAQSVAVLVHTIYDIMRSADDKTDAEMAATLQAAIRSLSLDLMGVVGND